MLEVLLEPLGLSIEHLDNFFTWPWFPVPSDDSQSLRVWAGLHHLPQFLYCQIQVVSQRMSLKSGLFIEKLLKISCVLS
jgi:hypothetical protein